MDNSNKTAEIIWELKRDEEQLYEHKTKAFTFCLERYNVEIYKRELLEIYNQIL
jgi:hypothetical protein